MNARIGWLIVFCFAAACTGPPVEKGGDDNNVVIITNNEPANGGTNNSDPVLTECGPGRTLCGDECVDTAVDGVHCGRCDNACNDGMVCSEGQCTSVPDDCRTEGTCPARYFCDENTGLCEVGCNSNQDCPDGSYCELESHACLCSEEGNVVCGDECVAESPTTCGTTCETCPPIANGAAVCVEGECGQKCDDGHKMCDGTCAACPSGDGVVSVGCLGNECVATECEAGYEICDGTCAGCPATTGDESLGCDGAQCVITDCPTGTRLCDGTCAECPDDPNGTLTCDGEQCVVVCSSGYHSCGGEYCAPDGDVSNCGSSCDTCQGDSNGTATCNGGSCGLECDTGYRECQDACAECPTGPGVMSTMCAGANCVVQSCEAGYQPCSAGCCTQAPDGVAYDYDQAAADAAIAVDSKGYPHIVFGSASANEIYYVWWDGSAWQSEYVTSGWHADIELDLMDRPHIAIWRRLSSDQLWYGVRDPMSGWMLEEADTTFNDAGMTPDLELQGNTPHIAHYNVTQKNLRYAVKSGATWEDVIVVASDESGFSPTLTFLNSEPHIVYRNETTDRAMHVWNDGVSLSSWDVLIVDDTRDAGNYSSLAADNSGDLHLVFEEEGTLNDPSRLYYTTKTFGFWEDGVEIAEGSEASMVLDGNDSPVVVFWNPSSSDLQMASAANGWTATDLVTTGSVGGNNAAVYSPATGKVHVVYEDYTNRDIEYLTIDP